MSVRELTAPPRMAAQYWRAVLGALTGKKGKGQALPALELVMRQLKIDPARLHAYNRVCGFEPSSAALPPTYPFVLAFALHMEIMTDPAFPYPAMGLVHIRNSITQHRPVRASEIVDIHVRAAHLRAHDKGMQFDILTTLRCDQEVLWESVSTMLRRSASGGGDGASSPSKSTADKAAPTAAATAAPTVAPDAQWAVPSDIGRRYGAVSGDRNPIHMHALSARLFGFPRAIAHGMWSKARCLAALADRLPPSYTVDVQFKLPVLLPARVALRSHPASDGSLTFALNDAKSDKPHLAGTLIPRADKR